MTFVSQHKGAIVWSVMLHVAVAAAFTIGFRLPARERAAPATVVIEGTLVDTAAIEREREKREQDQQRRQREERQRREVEQRERERVATEQRAREQAAEQAREREAAEKRRQEQAAREQREREEQRRVEAEAAAKREREAAERRRQQQQAEAQLQQELAAEAERMSAQRAGLLDQYIRDIENRIKSRWDKPLSARPGLDCIIDVVQLPTGDVVSARVSSCNGDEAVVRSIERAVEAANPLPRAPTPAVFERNLRVRFRPDR